jgi:hypothetical protein
MGKKGSMDKMRFAEKSGKIVGQTFLSVPLVSGGKDGQELSALS